LGKTIFRRNQLTSDLFSRIQFGEKMGTGFKRMKDICKTENTPYPKIDYTDIHFYTVFRQSREYLKMAETEGKVTEKVTESSQKLPRNYPETIQRIIDLIREKPDITRQKLAEEIGISPDGVKYHLTRLKNKGTIKRIGPDKGGYWKAL